MVQEHWPLIGHGAFRVDYNEHLRRGLSISAAFRRSIAVFGLSQSAHIFAGAGVCLDRVV